MPQYMYVQCYSTFLCKKAECKATGAALQYWTLVLTGRDTAESSNAELDWTITSVCVLLIYTCTLSWARIRSYISTIYTKNKSDKCYISRQCTSMSNPITTSRNNNGIKTDQKNLCFFFILNHCIILIATPIPFQFIVNTFNWLENRFHLMRWFSGDED